MSDVAAVDRFRAWLAGVDIESLSDRQRVELVASLERVKGASSAVQARATDALRCSREVVAPRDVARSVGSVVALARRESPRLGDRFVGLSRALVHEMPHTMAALTEGGISERVAVVVVQGTATLSREDRAEVDHRLAGSLRRLGVKQAGRAATRVAAELDAASVVARMEAAARSRRVSVRPAPDGMAYLTVLGPLKDVVGAHAAVQARSRSVVGGQCPEELPEGRGVGAVAADTALRLLSGRAVGQPQPVEVHLVMTDRALLGTGDGDRSVFEPARVPGHGSVPAPVARAWLREGLTDPPPAGPDASPPTGAAALPPAGADAFPPTGSGGSSLTGSDPDVGTGAAVQLSAGARVWVRRLYTSPDGRDLVAMDSRRRVFGGMLRRMLVLRDDVCTTPWCEAPIVHADHATPVREDSETTFEEGNGKCAGCNYGKEAPGWRTRVILGGADRGKFSRGGGSDSDHSSSSRRNLDLRDGPSDGDGGARRSERAAGKVGGEDMLPARRVVRVTTPLGHSYDAEPPPLLGWGSRTFPVETARPPEPPSASGAPADPSATCTPEVPPRISDAPVAPSPARASEVRSATVEGRVRPEPERRDRSRRSEQASARPPQVARRKRALRRARTLTGTALDRSRRARRPRLTSHLERELCRYLT